LRISKRKEEYVTKRDRRYNGQMKKRDRRYNGQMTKRDRRYNGQMKKSKRTTIHKILHRNVTIEQQKGVNADSPEDDHFLLH
jgi:ribosomal protein L37E